MNELVYIQSNLKAPKNQFNSFGNYKYRSCEDILEAVKPLLKEVNCVLTIRTDVCSLTPLSPVSLNQRKVWTRVR